MNYPDRFAATRLADLDGSPDASTVAEALADAVLTLRRRNGDPSGADFAGSFYAAYAGEAIAGAEAVAKAVPALRSLFPATYETDGECSSRVGFVPDIGEPNGDRNPILAYVEFD